MPRKLFALATLLAPLFAHAEALPEAPQTFYYDISFGQNPEVRHVAVRAGESKVVEIPGAVHEYTREATSMPGWEVLARINNGSLPAHDSVVCKDGECLLGQKGIIQEAQTLKVSAEPNGEVGTTVVAYHDAKVVSIQDVATLQGMPSVSMGPTTKHAQSRQKVVLRAGDTYTAEGTDATRNATVKLVRVD